MQPQGKSDGLRRVTEKQACTLIQQYHLQDGMKVLQYTVVIDEEKLPRFVVCLSILETFVL